jgi:hypothetical protein
MLTPSERGLLLQYCRDHPLVFCPTCCKTLSLHEVGTDLLLGRRDFCPACRLDLTAALHRHIAECTVVRVQARELEVRSAPIASPRAIDESRRLCDAAADAIDRIEELGKDYLAIEPRDTRAEGEADILTPTPKGEKIAANGRAKPPTSGQA